MTYEFIYEFMYMKNIVKSYLNSCVLRFQMMPPTKGIQGPELSANFIVSPHSPPGPGLVTGRAGVIRTHRGTQSLTLPRYRPGPGSGWEADSRGRAGA